MHFADLICPETARSPTRRKMAMVFSAGRLSINPSLPCCESGDLGVVPISSLCAPGTE